MAHVILFNWTQQGIADYKSSPQRIQAARDAVEAAGGKLTSALITMGAYDGLVVVEGLDDETVAKILLATGAQGNISTQTMRAFSESEFSDLVSG